MPNNPNPDPAEATNTGSVNASPPPQHLILVVDDVLANLKVLRGFLADQYRLTFATSGPQALERVKAAQPDLILLDLMMPDMDGIEVCHQLKQSPETAEIPIIFLTASYEVNDLTKAFKSGATDYVTKPFRIPELLARIKTYLELTDLRQQLASTVQQLNAAHAELARLRGPDPLAERRLEKRVVQ